MRKRKELPLEERFWQFVMPEPNSGCWLWIGSRYHNGYGHINIRHRGHLVHRVAWQLLIGEIPDGLRVLHKCDTTPCVNPDHLYLGSALDNTRDCLNRLRFCRGEQHHQGKMTVVKVKELRQLRQAGVTTYALAQTFGISQPVASLIARGKSWGWVE